MLQQKFGLVRRHHRKIEHHMLISAQDKSANGRRELMAAKTY